MAPKRKLSSLALDAQELEMSRPVRRSGRHHVEKMKAETTVSEDKLITEAGVIAKSITTSAATLKTKGKRKAQSNANGEEIDYSALVSQRVSSKWKVGAHVSAAGGVENSVLNAARIGAPAFALFLKSQRKWESPPLKDESITLFKERMKTLGYEPGNVLPHGSYLINLGNPDAEKREKSYQCFLDDLKRCDQLGLELYNFHPGSTTGLVQPSESIQHIASSINRAHKDTPGSRVVVVLENMAGAGNVIGSSFEELGEIIALVEDKERVGVCLDTCHLFAAGYDIRTKEGWDNTLKALDTHVGLSYLRGLHLNDSQTGLGSKRDRHENLGMGTLSLHSFHHILTDPRTQGIPMVLETPSHEESRGLEDKWDVWRKEIQVLNRLSELESSRTGEGGDGVLEDSTGEIEELTEEMRGIVKLAKEGTKAKAKSVGGTGKRRRTGKDKDCSEDEDE
ncbi:DNA-(apurinic or apyrimidinic site) lyase [Stygiomarasmius scandens]|uniref:DNA-(Apurinic or apyrimidinic site) lyase n=1 Tax=Marasmiellus scandens TaxID=2682957 RepID=A0ABR1J7G9_9AGAR